MNTGMVGRDTPLRLARAVELAFPEGGMTVSGLRREIARGRLEAETIAGKTFVTLAGIDRMRELCRVQRKPDHRVSTRPVPAASPAVALASALRTVAELRERHRSKAAQAKSASR